MLNVNAIGKKIREYRIKMKLRQEDLAEMTGLSSNYISMVERGEKTLSLDSLINILNALNITADMVLSDQLIAGYQIQNSLLCDKISELTDADKRRLSDIIDVFLKHAEQ